MVFCEQTAGLVEKGLFATLELPVQGRQAGKSWWEGKIQPSSAQGWGEREIASFHSAGWLHVNVPLHVCSYEYIQEPGADAAAAYA